MDPSSSQQSDGRRSHKSHFNWIDVGVPAHKPPPLSLSTYCELYDVKIEDDKKKLH